MLFDYSYLFFENMSIHVFCSLSGYIFVFLLVSDSSSFCLIVQFSSVAQSCPTLCDPMNRSSPVLPVHHQLPEFTQTHLHQVGDAIQPSHPLPSPSPPAPNPSQLETPKTEPHRENYTQASRRKTCYIEMNFLQYFEETFNLFRSWPSNPILHSVNTICCCCLVTKSCPTLLWPHEL